VDRINILMVDNDPSKLLTYEAVLGELGENLIKAHSGDEALGCLLKAEIAIVLLDVNMPGLDGFQLADEIRRHPRYEDVAVIFVSASHLTEADHLKGYEHGAVDYISVPIIPDLLRAKVRVFGELYRKTRELECLNEEMRKISARMIAMQDEERRRLARELHDSLGQQLTVAKMIADSIKLPGARKQAEDVGHAIEEALRQVRSISHLLHPPLLEEIGLEFAIRWLLEGLMKRSSIETELDVQPYEFPRLSMRIENALYRITQEAVTNSVRHSGARKICVVLKKYDGEVSLAVCDDGKGISEDILAFRPGSVGVGIGGMRQRAGELGGKVRLGNGNPGTLVEVVIPTNRTETESSSSAQC
jgi:signal transduction histidine kinase